MNDRLLSPALLHVNLQHLIRASISPNLSRVVIAGYMVGSTRNGQGVYDRPLAGVSCVETLSLLDPRFTPDEVWCAKGHRDKGWSIPECDGHCITELESLGSTAFRRGGCYPGSRTGVTRSRMMDEY